MSVRDSRDRAYADTLEINPELKRLVTGKFMSLCLKQFPTETVKGFACNILSDIKTLNLTTNCRAIPSNSHSYERFNSVPALNKC